MDWHLILGALSGILGVASVIPYVFDILHGTTRPSIISQVLWLVIQSIAALAQLSAGASWSVIVVFATIFNCAVIVVLALFGYGSRIYRKTDFLCFFLAVLAIVLWQITSQPILAIVFAVLANFLAAIPTIAKTYRNPESEERLAWFLIMIAAILGVASTTSYSLENLVFPTYLIFETGTIFTFAFFGRLWQKRNSS